MSLTVKTNPFIIFCIVVCSLIGIYSAVNVYLKLTEVKVADSIGNSKTFDVPEQQQLLSTERTSVNVKGTNWSLNSFDSFNDQAQRDAEARAALNSQLYSSYQAAQSQERPSGLGGGSWQSIAPLAPGNNYAPGNCTWYAYNRRYALGNPVPPSLGNGGGWHYRASSQGYSVDHTPQVGDVVDLPRHVAVVEAIGENDTVYISEMNLGWVLYSFQWRWIPNASSYWYIH